MYIVILFTVNIYKISFTLESNCYENGFSREPKFVWYNVP